LQRRRRTRRVEAAGALSWFGIDSRFGPKR